MSTRTVSEHSESNVPAGGPGTTPPTVLLRADSQRPPIRLTDPKEENSKSAPQERAPSRITNEVIDSRSKSQRLTIIDSVDGDEVSTFVSGTDFSSETLYLETNQVQECFRLQLCHASWHPDKIETDYVRYVRPFDEPCSVDNRVFESRLIRFPVALDAESIHSFASSIGSGGRCDGDRRARAEGVGSGSKSASTPQNRSDQQ